MKKQIITDQIKRYDLFQKLCYLSPIIILIRILPEIIGNYKYIKQYNNPESSKLYFSIYAIGIVTLSVIIVIIARTVVKYIRWNAIENSTFDSVTGLEYYRDELEELRPVEISYLMDLDLETRKDISAQILQYELWGVIEYVNGKIVVKNINDPRLLERDKILINILVNKSEDFGPWKKKVHEDMINSKYIVEREDTRKELGKMGNRVAIMLIVTLILCMVLIALANLDKIKYIISNYSNINFNEYDFDLYKPFSWLEKFSDFQNADLSNLVITKGELYFTIAFFILTGLFFGYLASMLIFTYIAIKTTNKTTKLARTEEGNKITEYLFGLKNFIKDFTLLSEREKKELVLWDYFLVYAVVLEENKKVTQEIFSYRPEKHILNFMENKTL